MCVPEFIVHVRSFICKVTNDKFRLFNLVGNFYNN